MDRAEVEDLSRVTTSDPSSEIVEHIPTPQCFVGERRHAMTLHRVALQACMAANRLRTPAFQLVSIISLEYL